MTENNQINMENNDLIDFRVKVQTLVDVYQEKLTKKEVLDNLEIVWNRNKN